MKMLRCTVLSLALAVILAVTSLHMAVARGQGAAVGEMVLCIGGGIVTVSVDAEGNPTGPAHICPDCALSLIDMPGGPAALCSVDADAVRLTWIDSASTWGRSAGIQPVARGPPNLM